MPNIQDEIRSKTEAFANDIAGLVRRAALEAVATALGRGPVSAPARAARPAAPVKAPAPAPKAARPKAAPPAKKPAAKAAPAPKAAPAKKAAAAPKRPLGAKRPPAEIAKLTGRLGDYIKANPGLGMEAIGKSLATPTSELTLPIKKLLAAKKIRFEGHKRATKYFPA